MSASEIISANDEDAHDAKHAAIVEAAQAVFLAKGFAGASMDEIASEAQVSKRTVYNRFASKDALFGAVIVASCERLMSILDAHFTTERPLRDELIDTATQFLREVTSTESIALRRITAFESMRFPELGVAYLENGMYRLVDALEPHMRELVERGVLAIEDFPRAIKQLGALVSEPLETKLAMGVQYEDLEAEIEEQARTGVEAFLKIYAVPGAPNTGCA